MAAAGATAGRIVVIAVDASDNAKDAFNWYLTNMHRADDLVVVAHVPELSDNLPALSFKHGLSLPVEEWQKALKEQNEKTKKLEENYEGELIAKKIKYKVRCDPSKNPGPAIVNIAESEKANFIVVGTRGLDVVRRTLLGSVSDYIIHHSRIPVLVCPRTAATASS